MVILHEDEHKLDFVIYPTKTFLLLNILFLLLFASIFNLNILLSPTAHWDKPYLVGCAPFYNPFDCDPHFFMISSLIFSSVFLANILVAYLFPIKVTIDKLSQKLTYRDKTLRSLFSSSRTISIDLKHLEKVKFQTSMPERKLYPMDANNNPVFISLFYNVFMGKFCFVMNDQTTIPIYAGPFSFGHHKKAFMKIADYLHIPYEEPNFSQDTDSKEYKKLTPSKRLVKIMIRILIFLIIIVALLVVPELLASIFVKR